MSKESYIDFYENYLNSSDGEALQTKLNGVKDGDEFLAVATEGGKAAGFDFTKDEVREVMRAAEARMAKDAAEAQGEELSDEQLENVAGGAFSLSSTSLKISKMPSYLDSGKLQYSTVMCPW